MPGPRDYSAATRAALATLSRGRCYFPDCTTPILTFVSDDSHGILPEPVIDFQIAHIRDARPGNRYVEDMDDDERRAFANLILLCTPHHKWVDKIHPSRYSIETLEEWKRAREGPSRDDLTALGALDSDDLDSLLTEAGRADEHAAALSALRGSGRPDIVTMTRLLGAAVATLPHGDENAAMDFVRALGELPWVRRDWHRAQETVLFRTLALGEVLTRFDTVLAAFSGAISDDRGYTSIGAFLGSPSLSRAIDDEGLASEFVTVIRTRLSQLIVHRAIGKTLMPVLLSGTAPASDAGTEEVHFPEARWALPEQLAADDATREFEIFDPRTGFSFRARVTTRTIDLYGVREGHSAVFTSPLAVELIDPIGWWMVLVPTAVSRLVYDAEVRRSYGLDHVDVIELTSTLASAGAFSVGLP